MVKRWRKALLLRVLPSAGLLIATSIGTFLLVEMSPGDFLTGFELENPGASDAVEALRARHRLDQPLAVRYWHWVVGLARGDWGTSAAHGTAVLPLTWPRVQATLALTLGSQAVAWAGAVSIALGLRLVPGRMPARLVDGFLSVLLALPEVVVALAVAAAAIWSGSAMPEWSVAAAALILSALPFAGLQVRDALNAANTLPFVEWARRNRLPEWKVVARYQLPAAAPPLLALAGVSLGGALSSSLLVECVTGYPGLGALLVDAVLARDTPVVAAAVLWSAIFWSTVSFFADLLQVLADPRTRLRP